MTVQITDTIPRVRYVASGGQTVFTVPYEFLDNEDLAVYINGTLAVYDATPTLNNEYSVTGAGVDGGGSITFGAGRTVNDVVVILRDTPVERLTDYPVSGPFDVEALNLELDRMAAMIRELEHKIERSLRLSATDTVNSGTEITSIPAKATRASKFLSFDANGEPTVSASTAGADGTDGADGADGSVIYYGSGAPSAGLGTTIDYYLRTSNSDFYSKSGGSWAVLVNLAGADGATILNGTGVPTSGDGNVGDYWIRTSNGQLYEKTDGSTWTAIVNLTGPTGATGSNGSNGSNGADGISVGTKLTFSTTTTDSDPGAGIIQFNNATIASVTYLYIDNSDGDSNSITDWLDAFDDSSTTGNRGFFMLRSTTGAFSIFRVTGAVVDGTGYRKVPVAYVAGTAPSNSAVCYAVFSRTGDQGAAGAGTGDVTTSGAVTAGRIARYNDGSGDIIEDSGYSVTDITNKLPLAGGTMTGFITLHADPDAAMKAATKQYVDTMLPKAGGTMTGKITLDGDPSSALHAATKQYVDGLALNLGKRARVRAATTANITISTALNNADTLDGVTLATGDLVLVKNQTAPAENGIYVVGVSPARFAEFDSYNEHPGSLIVVEEGTSGADTLWLCTSNEGGVLDTTAISFTQLIVTGQLLATNNLSDVSNAATARTNLSCAARSQTDFASVFIETPSNKDYTIMRNLPVGMTINSITTKTASGTCTVTGKINTTALGGTANSASSSEQEQTHSSSNVAVAGDDITLTISSTSSAADLQVTVKFTLTLS